MNQRSPYTFLRWRRPLAVLAAAASGLFSVSVLAAELPPDEALQALLEQVHERFADERAGELPQYIPALTGKDPERFAIALVTAEGRTFSVGDADTPFVIMSAAKPFTAALVMKQHGREVLRERIGLEPTGVAYNSITVIEDNPARSVNPLVNAGAMAAASLVQGVNPQARWETLLGWYSSFAGRSLQLDEAVYRSTREAGLRNQAVAALLRSYDRLYGEPEQVRDLYNRQSSVLVTAEDLAMMGATLAAGGRQPVTGERLLSEEDVTGLLALMTMAGLYDGAGAWAWDVGLPAKSGVGGGIVAVAPGRVAIAAFSPRLDEKGNSVRAQAALRELSARLELGVFGPLPMP